jgi:hypothetical protein
MSSETGFESARVRIVIEGDYPVRPGDEEAYPGCTTIEECVAADFAATQDGTWDIIEMITCLAITSEAAEVMPAAATAGS